MKKIKTTNTVAKRSYQIPKLTKVGSVKSLTRGGGGSNTDGNMGNQF